MPEETIVEQTNTEVKKKRGRPAKNEGDVATLVEVVTGIVGKIDELATKIKALEEIKMAPTAPLPHAPTVKMPQSPPVAALSRFFPPLKSMVNITSAFVTPDIRAMVSDILGEEFGVEIEHPFTVHVIVPPEYADPTQLKNGIEDRRTIVMQPAEGLEGIKQYCLKIKANILKYKTMATASNDYLLNSKLKSLVHGV